MKKFLTFVLVLAMVLSVSSVAMAVYSSACSATDHTSCTHVASITDGDTTYYYETLQAAIDDAESIDSATPVTVKIQLLADISNDVTISQEANLNLVIDGAKADGCYKMTSTIYIEGNARHDKAETLTIKNIVFERSGGDAISSNSTDSDKRYAHNVTIEGCTFNFTGDAVAARFRQAYNIEIIDCEVNGGHSLLWSTGGAGISVEDTIIENSQNGISFGTTSNCEVSGCDIDVEKIGIRGDGSSNNSVLTVSDTNVNAAHPVVVRKTNDGGYTVEVGEGNTMTSDGDNDWCTVYSDNEETEVAKSALPANVIIPSAASAVAEVDGVQYTDLKEALKAIKDNSTLKLLSDVTISEDWDARYTGGKITASDVTIDGNGHTITITSSVNDAANHFAFFRFEADAAVKNLTMDMSGAPEAWGNRFRAISAKGNLEVDNCTFIGNPDVTNTRAIIFGEGAGTNVGNLEIKITNSTFKDWRYGIRDNENGQDVKSVEISGNEFDNAGVNVCAKESITFTNNTLDNSAALLHSYTNRVAGSTEKGKPDSLTVTGNTLDGKTANTVDENGNLVEDPAPSQSPEINPTTSSGNGISVKYNGGNSFSTSNPAVPTGVEIDGVPVTFNGTGSNFSVGCISSDAKWVTVRWNSTSVTTNFTPDGLVECTTVSIPKTGDMSIWAAVAAFFGF